MDERDELAAIRDERGFTFGELHATIRDFTGRIWHLEEENRQLRAALGKTTQGWCGFVHGDGTMQAGCDYCGARGEPVPAMPRQPHDRAARDAWWADYEERQAQARASVVHAPDCPVALAQGEGGN